MWYEIINALVAFFWIGFVVGFLVMTLLIMLSTP